MTMSYNTRLRVQLVLYNVGLLICFCTADIELPKQAIVTRPSELPPLTSAVYISSTRFPALSEFTVCTWIKPAEYHVHQQNGMSVGQTGFYIHAYHTGEDSYDNIITMVYHHSHNFGGLLVFWVNSESSASMSVPNFLSNSWKHICGRWDSEAHDTFVHYLDSEDGGGDYLSASGLSFLTVQPIAAGTDGGSMVLFHQQTGGPALSVPDYHPLGTLGYDDSTIGSIASFQFFSVYLPEKVFSLLGCGLRADIFDSFYDDYEYMGEGIGYTIEQEQTPCCSASSEKWFGAPLSDTFNCLQTDEVTNTVFSSFYAKNKVLCAAICFKVPQCDSFNYEELKGTCELSSLTQILFPCENCVPGFAANTVQMCTSIHGVNKESIDNLLSTV